MIIRPINDWQIRTKLIGTTLLLVLLPLLLLTDLSLDRFGNVLRSGAEEDLELLVGNIYSMCKGRQEMVQKRVIVAQKIAIRKIVKYIASKQYVVGRPE